MSYCYYDSRENLRGVKMHLERIKSSQKEEVIKRERKELFELVRELKSNNDTYVLMGLSSVESAQLKKELLGTELEGVV